MEALRIARNIVGMVGLCFFGYIFLAGLSDARRYVRISRM